MPESPLPPVRVMDARQELMQLVPQQVGKWKRQLFRLPETRIDGFKPSSVLAEFRHGKLHVKVTVTQSDPKPTPVSSAVVERNDAVGTEKLYVESNAMVRETHRVADGRTDVQVSRADGISVNAQAYLVPASELKTIAMAIKAAAR